MDKILGVVNWIASHYQSALSALVGILTGIIGVCMMIPGDQPEKFLQGVVDFLAKFSKKPADPQ